MKQCMRTDDMYVNGKRKVILVRILGQFCFFLLLVLTFSYKWAVDNYGNIGLDEIAFHLNMPLKGVGENYISSYIEKAIVPAFFLFFLELGLVIGIKVFAERKCSRENRFKGLGKLCNKKLLNCVIVFVMIFWTLLLVKRADDSFGLVEWIQKQFEDSVLIEKEYVNPEEVQITFPAQKRNLICIFMESAETSAQDVQNGGFFENNYIPEMTNLANENVSFSQSDLLEGAAVAPACGWTMAALVAETSGIPLKLYQYTEDVDNSMGEYEYFLPGAVALGDILEKEGYRNYFMVGSYFGFGGRTAYFSAHGNYEMWDYDTAVKAGKIPEDYYRWWGYEDEKLYEYAREKIVELASEEEPFNFSMLTVDTHHNDGYVCELCGEQWGNKQYANVWSCASKQLDEFVSWIEEQDFYENTTIVIIGDHCSMDADFYGEVTSDKHHGSIERKVYNAFVNVPLQPVNEKNRRFTTMDFYPTILASMGCEIEGDRLGLGTNLFSEKPTLAEEYGYEYLFEELEKKSYFYDYELLYK